MITLALLVSVVQLLNCVQLVITPWAIACQAPLFFTISQSLLTLMSIELVMSSNHLILCHSLLLLPSILPIIMVFSNESILCIKCRSIWSSSFSISSSSEYSGMISFRIYWFDLLAVQGTLKSLLQYHDLKVSILLCSAFFMVQLSRVMNTCLLGTCIPVGDRKTTPKKNNYCKRENTLFRSVSILMDRKRSSFC